MDSRYHNLPAGIVKVEATATDTASIGNTVQRSTYHQSPHNDDVSSISDDRDYEETGRSNHERHPPETNEKGSTSAAWPVSHPKSIDRAHTDCQPIHQFQSRSMPIKNFAHDWWIFELGALAISYMAMLALVIALKVCENKPIPRWPGHITLNAFISVTSTIMKAAIAVPISASISQMKWIWFKERSAVRGMQVFDEASRGPLGALKLLFSKYVRSLASLGALIVLL